MTYDAVRQCKNNRFKLNIDYYSPIKTAPRISNMDPRIQACFKVKTLAPTEDPNEFATSFAPMPNARMNAMMKATTTIQIQASFAITQ